MWRFPDPLDVDRAGLFVSISPAECIIHVQCGQGGIETTTYIQCAAIKNVTKSTLDIATAIWRRFSSSNDLNKPKGKKEERRGMHGHTQAAGRPPGQTRGVPLV